ncbi:MAG: esterase/lipase family protein [Pyrinomonadaceae bacterium]
MDILDGELEVLTGFDKEIRSHALPIWFESLAGIDWTLLHLSPVYYGFGARKGAGEPVVIVPGFLGSDVYLYELYFWLSRIGYKPYASGIGWNADCLNTLSVKLIETIERAHKETGKKVNLIGHSLGGVLSRSAAVQRADIVDSVITLGSPFRGVTSHPQVIKISERIRQKIFRATDKTEYPLCYTGHCNCAAVTALHNGLPDEIRQTAIYTKSDGIVFWKNCMSRKLQNNFEVSGTHIGLVYNFQAYKLIAERILA